VRSNTILVHAGRLQQVFARQRPLRRVEKGDQQRVFALRQGHRGACRVGQAPRAPIQQPAAEPVAAPFRIPLRGRAARLAPAQHRADAGQQFAQAERLGHVVIRAQFQPDDPIDLVPPVTGGDDDRNIGLRPDRPQQIEPVRLAEMQVQDHQVGSLSAKSRRMSCGPEAATPRMPCSSR